MIKLGDIFIFIDSTDHVVCKLCKEACGVGDFSIGKR